MLGNLGGVYFELHEYSKAIEQSARIIRPEC